MLQFTKREVSLVRRIATPIVAVSVISLALFGLLISKQFHNAIDESMDTKLQSTLNFIAKMSAPYVKNYDYYALEGFAREAIKDEDIDSLIFKKDGSIFVEVGERPASEAEKYLSQHIMDNESVLGEVVIGYNDDRIVNTMRKAMLTNGLAILLEQLLLIGCVFYIIKSVSYPVARFLNKIRHISEAKDYQFRFQESQYIKTNIREFNNILSEIDNMLNEIEKRDIEIQETNEVLERKVEERTFELQQSVEKLKSMQQILIESSKFTALGEMAAGIAHEINNPLAIISLASTALPAIIRRPHVESRARKLQEYVDRINNAIIRISNIIKGLKSFSRQSSSDPLTLESVDKVIKETTSFCHERFRNSEITVYLPELQGEQIYCRPTEVSQILLNLLNNAYDAVSHLQDASERWVKVEVHKQSQHLVISVSNGGPQIMSKIADKIFHPFFTTKPVGQGTGMGLSISKGIAEAHGGTLSLNVHALYTQFELKIPQV
ncbi:MAG: hypothetical protein BroJett040_14650 [Oligoflexia bacterium]|nr:MAG: hypothetical protein BroJett040_14650 [Oligoflexia bacterium]